MRELKFRYVYKNTQTGEIRTQILRLQAIEESGREFILPRAIEVLIARDEFTGLKDKNGKEIYEGDILGRESFLNWLVKWHDGGFVAENITGIYESKYYPLTQVACNEREVIFAGTSVSR